MNKRSRILIAFFIIIILVIAIIWFVNQQKSPVIPTAPTATPTIIDPAENTLIPLTSFDQGLGTWYEQSWFQKPTTPSGEITTDTTGVIFTSTGTINSRSGIMLDINKEVTQFSNLTLKATITATDQTLPGTGFNGREAPVAISVGYIDEQGITHNQLSENPNGTNNAFWRGFYFIEPSGASTNYNEVRVSEDTPYNFEIDLMSLNPKPKTIIFVALEGAGWRYRRGIANNISLIGSR